ncbi:prepilin-type N-terminal cleavage/methylation domain-containing protein [Candidatus Gracilibacteria bacterium]|nr:prepilin-type N-terminal cleavage/methylation domain-containing protein [Candidatus Gracilibacteria bacterium]
MKKGFTLMEVLIVIAISAFLAMLAVGSYNSYRKGALLNLGGDQVLSVIEEMKSKAIHDDFGDARKAAIEAALEDGELAVSTEDDGRCFGVLFENLDGEGFDFYSFSQEFVGEKVWEEGEWRYKGCVGDFVKIELLRDPNLQVVALEGVGFSFWMKFLPPDGDMEYFVDSSFDEGFEELKFEIQYGVDEKFKKTVVYDL